MISIKLGSEPDALIQNAVAWGEEYSQALKDGEVKPQDRYRRNDIRDALKTETFKKCAYCESKFEHVSYSHIEHILPKSRLPNLVCTWANLTLACEVCNVNKGSYYDKRASLLNPYTDKAEVEITFYGPMAIERSDKAKLTISIIKLNRPDLLLKRYDKLQEVLNIIKLILTSGSNQAIRNALTEDLNDKLIPESEYTNCVRCFVSDEAKQNGIEIKCRTTGNLDGVMPATNGITSE